MCDGFVGNVALKTMEGVAGFIATILSDEFRRSPLRQVQGVAASTALHAVRDVWIRAVTMAQAWWV